MPAFVVAAVVAVLFFLGYRFYASYLAAKVYALDPAYVTPAHEFDDGVDFVPTNKHVLFGHHFAAISGAGPSVLGLTTRQVELAKERLHERETPQHELRRKDHDLEL